MEDKERTSLKEIMEGAVATREFYLAYIEAGFTPNDSMKIICAVMGGYAKQIAEKTQEE